MRKSKIFFVLGIVLSICYDVLIVNTGLVFAAEVAPFCDAKAAAQVMGAAFVWSGECRDGLPEGRGTATFSGGRLFFGDMVAGLFQGTGTLTLPGGERYTGEFASGRFQGQGVYTFANGDRYVGEFQAGVFNGSGVFRKQGDAERYLVEYENGEQTKFEVDVGAAALVAEPVLNGVRSELLRRVAKVQGYILHTLGLTPVYTSGYRDAAKNAAVGGVLDSLHMTGRAVDLVVTGCVPEQEERIAAFAAQQGLWALWHGAGEDHHLHLQWDEE